MTTTDQPVTALPTQYQAGEVEAGLYDRWEARGYFTAAATSDRPPYCIVIPPPNVTGNLHVGHAFEHTLMDSLVRRARMQGRNTLWLPGMDHASIAVHALVERALVEEGTSRRELGREAFIARVWRWKEEYGGAILNQMRRLGDSVDWTRERFTLDAGLSRAVQTTFKRLYDDGLIYRAERLVNWSPVLRSVLSDAEVQHRDVEGELVSMRYGADGGPSVVVATTRVETMLGDTAVAVHPDDERYRDLVGTEIELPLTGRTDPGDRRRPRRSRVRHRRGQGHSGPRSERLRHRPAPRPADDHDDGRTGPGGRHRHRVRRPGSVRRPGGGAREVA